MNTHQINLNEDQTVINDKTKFDLRFNNIYAIVIAVFVVAGSWFNLSSRIDLLTERVNTMIQSQSILLEKYSNLEGRYGTQALAIKELQTLAGIK